MIDQDVGVHDDTGHQSALGPASNAMAGRSTTLDLQHTTVNKEKGEFVLMHGMSEAGYFHLVLTDPERYSRQYANVYFGTGDKVLRKKSY